MGDRSDRSATGSRAARDRGMDWAHGTSLYERLRSREQQKAYEARMRILDALDVRLHPGEMVHRILDAAATEIEATPHREDVDVNGEYTTTRDIGADEFKRRILLVLRKPEREWDADRG